MVLRWLRKLGLLLEMKSISELGELPAAAPAGEAVNCCPMIGSDKRLGPNRHTDGLIGVVDDLGELRTDGIGPEATPAVGAVEVTVVLVVVVVTVVVVVVVDEDELAELAVCSI